MGKWTHNYTDDVLHAKVSALVTGAIRRSALENPGALPPTYNEFVSELDTGDSFTTTMVDILVKEVMERRKRPAGDRRFISEKTAKNLRLLSGSLSNYHGRTTTTTTSRMTRYPPIRPTSREPFYVDTDEDEFDVNPDSDPNPAEGTHMSSSALFDAMNRNAPLMASSSDSTTAGGSSIPPPPLVLPPRSGRVSPWTALPATSTNPHTTRTISQPSSLRRPVGAGRSRDLPEWPPRRPRIRAAALAPRPSPAELVTEPRDAPEMWPTSTAHRRFFGLNRIRRATMAARRGSVGLSEGSGEEDGAGGVSFLDGTAGQSSSGVATAGAGPSTAGAGPHIPPPPQSWPEGSQIYVSPRAVMLRDIDPAPPLRRGGVLPPEAMMPQLHMQYMHLPTEPPSPPNLDGIEVVDPVLGEPAAYPTPGSVDNEQSA